MTAVAEPHTESTRPGRRWFPVGDGPGWGGAYGLLFVLGYAPLLGLFLVNLWGRPHYQFFPLALVGAGFLAWSRWKVLPRPLVPGDRRVTMALMAGSFLLLAVATVYWSPWLSSLAAVTGLAGMLWWRGGRALLTGMVPALIMVLTIIPPPLAADTRLIQHMRVLAVRSSSTILDLLGVTHALSGNVIELPRQHLLVDEACSGINSVLITLACSLFYGMWRRRSPLHIFICLANALAFVLLGNLTRITLGAWVKFRFGVDILSGMVHEGIGLFLFASYVVMILSTDRLLVYLLSPVKPPAPPPDAPAPTAASRTTPAALPMPKSWVRAAGCAFALVGLAGFGLVWARQGPSRAPAVQPKSALRTGATFAMPDRIAGWERLTTEVPPLQKVETLGVFSQVWHYRRGDTIASVGLDYPFHGYHDVTLCYTLRGWDLMERRPGVGRGTNASPPFAEVRLQNNVGLHGALWFSVVDESGRWLPGPAQKPGFRQSLRQRVRLGSPEASVTYQMQVLSTGFNPLRPEEREQARQFFDEARMILYRQLFEQIQRKS